MDRAVAVGAGASPGCVVGVDSLGSAARIAILVENCRKAGTWRRVIAPRRHLVHNISCRSEVVDAVEVERMSFFCHKLLNMG